jgi:hypothetical protein
VPSCRHNSRLQGGRRACRLDADVGAAPARQFGDHAGCVCRDHSGVRAPPERSLSSAGVRIDDDERAGGPAGQLGDETPHHALSVADDAIPEADRNVEKAVDRHLAQIHEDGRLRPRTFRHGRDEPAVASHREMVLVRVSRDPV